MDARLAFTSGGMQVFNADGSGRIVPAGPCYILPPSAPSQSSTVRWEEGGITRSATISPQALRGYLMGCIVQYS